MRVDVATPGTDVGLLQRMAGILADGTALRSTAIAAGICCAILFVIVGLLFRLQEYGDGSMFAYSVAVQDPWAFHWHNISGRLFVYLSCFVPAEAYIGVTRDVAGGILLYGFLFFVAPLLGLAGTFAADRSKGRIIFSYACASTACFCPLVFGFPTEMWIAHAMFWPTLAVCHYARRGSGEFALVLVMLLALLFTHAGALVLIVTIAATLLLRGTRDAALRRTGRALLVILPIWAATHAIFPPDHYYADVFLRSALHFFDVTILTFGVMQLLFGALAGYAIVVLLLRRLTPAKAHICAASLVAVALAVYWLWFDRELHADHRYYLRTVVLIGTAVLGAAAAAYALAAEGRLELPVPFLRTAMAALADGVTARALAGAIVVVLLVHTVETAKFVSVWKDYKAAVRALAMGTASDAALGDARFVSSARIGADLNRLSWNSTTLFLSILLAPRFAPARLVVDPTAYYFWLSCETATANENADRAVPVETRRLVRVHACLHR